jgi:hypothetical protein
MSIFEKLAHLVGNRKVPIPAMPGFSVPRLSFGSKATLKIIFFTVLVSLGAVGTGPTVERPTMPAMMACRRWAKSSL